MSPIEIAPICAPGMPGISNSGMPPPAACTSISISLSSSSPARSFLRNASLVEALALAPTSASSTRSSAACWARAWTSLRLRSRVSAMRDLDEVAHDLLDVAADIADLGELGRLDLEERRAGELGEAARDLGLADAGRPDHQNVLRQHLLAQPLVELQPAPAVAQRDRDRALGVALADDEAVELGNDLAGEKSVMRFLQVMRAQVCSVSMVTIAVGVDANVGRDVERPAHDRLGIESVVERARARRRAHNCRRSRCP